MHVLIATWNAAEAERLSQLLGGLGHTVAVASAPDQIGARVEERRPNVALFCAVQETWVRALELHPGRHVYRIGLLDDLEDATVERAWAVGFDDVAHRGASAQELSGRVAAVDRIRGWLPSMDEAYRQGGFDVLSSEAVQGLGHTLATEFGTMVGGSLSATRIAQLPGVTVAAAVPLTLASDGKEITLGIGIPEGSGDAFGELLFGEAVGRDILADAAREFANTAGGALKRVALDDGKTYSLGLPVDCVFPQAPDGAPVWRLEGSGIQLVVWTSVVDGFPRRITAGMLTEGMVLTQPVLSGSGTLIVKAGSVLTKSTVSRLLEVVGPSTMVEVVRAA